MLYSRMGEADSANESARRVHVDCWIVQMTTRINVGSEGGGGGEGAARVPSLQPENTGRTH